MAKRADEMDAGKVASEIAKVKLRSSDGVEFEVPKDEIEAALVVKDMLQHTIGSNDEAVPLSQIRAAILKKVLEWLKHKKENPPPPKEEDDDGWKDEEDDEKEKEEDRDWEPTKWEEDFLNVPQEELFDLIMAANYLNIHELLELGCRGVAFLMRGKTAEELRKMFGVEDDWPPIKKNDK